MHRFQCSLQHHLFCDFQVMDIHGDGAVTFVDFEAVMLGNKDSSIYEPGSLSNQMYVWTNCFSFSLKLFGQFFPLHFACCFSRLCLFSYLHRIFSWNMLDPADVGRVEPETAAANLRRDTITSQDTANIKHLLQRLDISGTGFVTKGQFARYVCNMLAAHSLQRLHHGRR